MELLSRLVHAEAGRLVVEVRAWEGDLLLGSALGEAANAEAAEDRARQRLLARLRPSPSHRPAAEPELPAATAPVGEIETASMGEKLQLVETTPRTEPTNPVAPQRQAATLEPEDWSGELAALELQLRRLGWDREREATYLQRAFGHPSRNRLTNYSDLRAYLQSLEHLAEGSEPATAAVPLRRSELLQQCDSLLAQLGWDAERGRTFLELELQATSRQQLNDQQLLQFNMLLETEMLAAASPKASVVPLNS